MEQMVVVGGNHGSRDLGRVMTETLDDDTVLHADEDCGKTFFLDEATGCDVTLPPIDDAKAGWNCKFVVKTAPTSNGYVISEDTDEDTNKIVTNGINELEVDTESDGPYNAGHTTVTLVHNVAVAGDHLEFLCDGTNWHCKGQTNADGGVTLA